jgi:hypothetical protein
LPALFVKVELNEHKRVFKALERDGGAVSNIAFLQLLYHRIDHVVPPLLLSHRDVRARRRRVFRVLRNDVALSENVVGRCCGRSVLLK